MSAVPTRLRLALGLTVLFHGSLLVNGTFRSTYDAYVHIFLGDHYARDWFSTWDQRWYTGFTTTSYPPGTHQAIAAFSKLVGLEAAFVIVQICALLLLTIGVYRFSRLWVDDEAAANASLLLVVSSAIAETVHLFGQLPTTFALAFLLNALPFIRSWVFDGRIVDLAKGTVVLAACTAGHHVTTLFGSVFFLGPVLVAGLLHQSRTPLPDEDESTAVGAVDRRTLAPLIARRIRRILPAVARGAVLGPCILGALVIVVLPYWLWSSSDPIVQIPIPHGSRANFLADLNIGLIFFFLPWGLMLLAIPYALVRATFDKKWPLAASILLLFVLGTGGTTPVPKLLLGPAFDILTLDRFTFWGAIQILPLGGLLVTSLERGSLAQWLRRTGGRPLLRGVQVSLMSAMVILAIFTASLSKFRPFQPDRIDTAPIVAFIEKDQHERWRFLTLGFGDQMAWLSAQTTATQVDGNYHSVRRLPELTSTSVERLEGAKYRGISGLGSLQQFLEVPEKYHLKFVFSNDAFYDPLLASLGWRNLGPLENGIEVWERADIEPLPATLPTREVPPWQRVMWGTVPPTAILSAVIVLGASTLPITVWPFRTSLLFGPIRRLDQRLKRWATLPPDAQLGNAGLRVRWRPRVLMRTRRWIGREVEMTTRRRRLAFSGLMIVGLVVISTREATAPAAPELVVEAYYDDLDFRRWRDAYDRLDPETRPGYELWRLQQSVNGGLLASFAKLDQIDTSTRLTGDDTAVVRTELRYLTSLEWYPSVEDVELVRRDGGWFVIADEPDLDIPPDQLARRPDVDFLVQGRRRVTSETSELTDIQDRPELRLDDARLLNANGRPVVVGSVTNIDVDPADLTITAILRDQDGNQLARYNATDHLRRTLLPRESTSFRIDFEQVAAGTKVDFDPLDFSPLEFSDEIASVEVYARAAVTSDGLFRGLQLNGLTVRDDAIEGRVRNDGTDEVVVPMALVTHYDADGRIAWVDRTYLADAVRPQRNQPFDLDRADLSRIEPTTVAVRGYASVVDDLVGSDRSTTTSTAPEALALQDGTRNRVDVTVISVLVN